MEAIIRTFSAAKRRAPIREVSACACSIRARAAEVQSADRSEAGGVQGDDGGPVVTDARGEGERRVGVARHPGTPLSR
jgi:hypothetical protein